MHIYFDAFWCFIIISLRSKTLYADDSAAKFFRLDSKPVRRVQKWQLLSKEYFIMHRLDNKF